MVRLLLPAALCLALAAPVPAPAQGAAGCAMQAGIADSLAAARRAGQSEPAAVRAVTGALPPDAAVLRPAVPLLAQWIFSLTPAQLSEDVGAAYRDACLAQ